MTELKDSVFSHVGSPLKNKLPLRRTLLTKDMSLVSDSHEPTLWKPQIICFIELCIHLLKLRILKYCAWIN